MTAHYLGSLCTNGCPRVTERGHKQDDMEDTAAAISGGMRFPTVLVPVVQGRPV